MKTIRFREDTAGDAFYTSLRSRSVSTSVYINTMVMLPVACGLKGEFT